MKYCLSCGYQIDDEEFDSIQKISPGLNNSKSVGSDETDNDRASTKAYVGESELTKKIKVPPGAKVKSKLPKSTTCVVCNIKSNDICYFCDFAVCGRHSVGMQILADKSKLGNVIQSCPECANKRKGQQPTNEEAEGIGFFFNIKPYHEWQVIDG
jgi:hypothetical protein